MVRVEVVKVEVAAVTVTVTTLNSQGKAWRERDVFFLERDPSLSYPHRPSSMPSWVALLTGSGVPLLVVLGTNVFRWRCGGGGGGGDSRGFNRRLRENAACFLFELLGLGQAVCLTLGTFSTIQAFTGSLRPNFFAACDYKVGLATTALTIWRRLAVV